MTDDVVTKKIPAPDMVTDGLRELILSGAYEPGFQLRQDVLAEHFGTSRIPVREALRRLQSEDLVVFYPNRGAVVRGLSLEGVLEMLDIRIALECRALRLAIPQMAQEDLDTAQDILNQYSAAPEPETWSVMNWRFHWAIYLPCNRPKLLEMIEANYGQVSRFTRTQVSLATGKTIPQREHEQILEFCRRGMVDEAVRLLEKHIEQTQKSIRARGRA